MMKAGLWRSSLRRGHDQQEIGGRDWRLARRNWTRKGWPWGWIQVRRQKGKYYRMGRSIGGPDPTGQTHTARPEWKEQFMLCFIKMCIILLF